MNFPFMETGPFPPFDSKTLLYDFGPEEGELFPPKNRLQKAQQQEITNSIGLTQCAALSFARPQDGVILDPRFKEPPFKDLFEWIQSKNPKTPAAHYFSPDVPGAKYDHRVKIALSNHPPSQKLNSKIALASGAFPIPKTILTTKSELYTFSFDCAMMLKVDGCGGGANVLPVASCDQAIDALRDFDPQTEIVLQKQLDLASYQEMSVDLLIYPNKTELSSIRRSLVRGHKWFGSDFAPIELDQSHIRTLLLVGKWCANEGYSHRDGWLCGVDFVIKDREICILEINARWTMAAVLNYARACRFPNANRIVGLIDTIPDYALYHFMRFVDAHPHIIAPISVAPHITEDQYTFLLLMAGDPMQSIDLKEDALGKEILPNISTMFKR